MNYIKKLRAKIGHDPIFMPAVSCFICRDEDKILLQRRTDNRKWAPHGGALEFGEDFLDALNRELKEELGITPKDPWLLGIHAGEKRHHIYPNGDEVYVAVANYLVEEYTGKIKPDANEVLELRWFNIDHLPPKEEIHPPDYDSLLEVVKVLNHCRPHP